ncbi:unnamed protein product, partial [Amoebophrya sp. A25]
SCSRLAILESFKGVDECKGLQPSRYYAPGRLVPVVVVVVLPSNIHNLNSMHFHAV